MLGVGKTTKIATEILRAHSHCPTENNFRQFIVRMRKCSHRYIVCRQFALPESETTESVSVTFRISSSHFLKIKYSLCRY